MSVFSKNTGLNSNNMRIMSETQDSSPGRARNLFGWLATIVIVLISIVAGFFGVFAVLASILGSVPAAGLLTVVVAAGVFTATRAAGGSWRRSLVVTGVGLLALAIVFRIGYPTAAFFIPNYWGATAVMGLVAGVAFWAIGRLAKVSALAPVGALVAVLPLLGVVAAPQGDSPEAKPAPQGATVDHWDLATGSRIGYVHYPAAQTDAPTAIVVHGGPGGGALSGMFDFGRELSAAGFDAYVYDQAGVGYSDNIAPEDYTVQRMVDDLDAIRLQIGADKVNLVGHSWGGTLVARYLVEHGDHVDRAVLQAPGHFGGDRPPKTDPNLTAVDDAGDLSFDDTYRFRLFSYMVGASDEIPAGFLSGVFSQDAAKQFVHERLDGEAAEQMGSCADATASGESDDGADPLAQSPNFNLYANLLISGDLISLDPVDGLADIATPVLITRGVCDHVQWAEQRPYRDEIPGATLVVLAGEGHDTGAGADRATVNFLQTGDPGLRPYTGDNTPAP